MPNFGWEEGSGALGPTRNHVLPPFVSRGPCHRPFEPHVDPPVLVSHVTLRSLLDPLQPQGLRCLLQDMWNATEAGAVLSTQVRANSLQASLVHVRRSGREEEKQMRLLSGPSVGENWPGREALPKKSPELPEPCYALNASRIVFLRWTLRRRYCACVMRVRAEASLAA